MGIRPLMIGIAGGSGSGKTYLARKVLAQAGDAAALLSMDQYFRTVDGDRRLDPHDINFDHPAHLDLEGMVRDLTALRAGKPILAPAYDFATQLQTPRAIPIEPKPVILVEGLFVLAEPVVGIFDLTVFLEVAPDQRLVGRILRDVKERGSSLEWAIDRYQRFVRPSYQVFVEPTKQYADVVVDFTYRRAFFQELLARTIAFAVETRIPIQDMLNQWRQDVVSLGLMPGRSVRPVGLNVLDLAKICPEEMCPTVASEPSAEPRLFREDGH